MICRQILSLMFDWLNGGASMRQHRCRRGNKMRVGPMRKQLLSLLCPCTNAFDAVLQIWGLVADALSWLMFKMSALGDE